MSSTALSIDPVTNDTIDLDPHERLRALYRTMLDHQEHFDEFKQMLALYALPADATEESPELSAVRSKLNARICEWIGPFDGLSVTQAKQWRQIIVEQRWNIGIAPFKESNYY